MRNLGEKLRNIDCTFFKYKSISALSFLSDQVIVQPINFQVIAAYTLNIEYVAEPRR